MNNSNFCTHASRIRRIAVNIAVVAAIAAGPSVVLAEDPPHQWLWPLGIEPAVSSSFCEYREGHLHAGLDIRTYGREGVACLAAGDGYVSRVRATPHGYGKAVYIQLDSGQTLVYAHLSEFSAALEEAVYAEQVRTRRYNVDFRPPPGQFPVRQGEVIAFTGCTGTAAPHLHFEIRDAGENPLNPFSHGFALEDKMPPYIDRVILVPLDRDARIDGRCFPIEVSARKTSANTYTVPDTLLLEGAVGVAAEIIDRLNPSSGKLAPYHAGLSVDGDTVSEMRLERFSFDHTSHVDFLYDIAMVRLDEDYLIQLFERTGESLWNRSFVDGGRLGRVQGEDVTETADGVVHSAVVTAADLAGNSCELTVPFYRTGGVVDANGIEARGHAAPASEIPGFYFFEGMMSVRFESHGKGRIPVDRLSELGIVGSPPDGRNGFATYESGQFADAPVTVPFYVGNEATYIHLCGLEKGRKKSIYIPSLDLQLVVGKRSLYTDMILYAAGWNAKNSNIIYGGLTPRSRIARIGPYSAVFKNDLEIGFLASRADSTAAVYRLNEKKMKWVFYESEVSDGVVSTTAKRPGVYTVLSDKQAPRIGTPVVRTYTSYATKEKHPEIVVPVEDTGSGVDDRRTAVYVAGIRQIARWDGNDKKMFVLVRDQNIMGTQALTVAAYDKIGNRSQLDAKIEVRHTRQQRKE